MSTHLKASLSGISRMADSLGRLAEEFAALTAVADDGAAAGNAELAAALSDLATGWSDKRNQLTGQLRAPSQGASEAARECRATDYTLAAGLRAR